jgi:hypothetical protein
MTSVQLSPSHVSSRMLVSLAWRAALVIVATVAIVLELPAWARAPLAIAAAAITVLYIFARFDRRGPLDKVLTSVGAVLVSLALLGILLNALPWGLSAASWGIGVGLIELVTLIGLTFLRPPTVRESGRARVKLSGIAWGVAIGVVLAGALTISTASFDQTHTAPLALSQSTSGNSTVVRITSGTAAGPYDLVRVSGTARTTLASAIEVGPHSSASVTVALHEGTREEIDLVKTGSTTVLRQVIIDTRIGTTKANQ